MFLFGARVAQNEQQVSPSANHEVADPVLIVAGMLEPSAKDNLEGDTLEERYVILSLLGSGSTCKVYLAQDAVIGRKVAIKVFHARREQQSAKRLLRFQREIKSLSRLSHENIIKLHSAGVLQGRDSQPYMVMDYVHGRTLEEVRTEEEPLSSERIVNLASQIASALFAAHEKGVIHRDIKPGNVYIVETEVNGVTKEVVKLLDFGMSRMEEELTRDTQSTSLCGTPAYMSPEQCLGKDVDHRTDIYSVGCLLYELVTGQPPFAGGSNFEVLDKHIREPVPTITDYHCDGLLDIIMKCLEKRAADRYQSAADLQRDLLLCHTQRFSRAKFGTRRYPLPLICLGVGALVSLVLVVGSFYGQPLKVGPAPPLSADELARYEKDFAEAERSYKSGLALKKQKINHDADIAFQSAINKLRRYDTQQSATKLLWINAFAARAEALNADSQFSEVPVVLSSVVPMLKQLTPVELDQCPAALNVYLQRAVAYTKMHDDRAALVDYKTVMNTSQLHPELGAIAALYAGDCWLRLNNYREALASYHTSHSFIRRCKSHDQMAIQLGQTCNVAGDTMRALKDFSNAIEAYDLSISLMVPVRSLVKQKGSLLLESRSGRAIALHLSNRDKEALEAYGSIVTQLRKWKIKTFRNEQLLASVLAEQASANHSSKNIKLAAEEFEESAAGYHRIHDDAFAVGQLLNAGACWLEENELLKARMDLALAKEYLSKVSAKTSNKEITEFYASLARAEVALAAKQRETAVSVAGGK